MNASASSQTSAETEIRATREASNLAIAKRDLVSIAATLTDDFVVIVGNGALLSRDEYITAFAHDFKDPTFKSPAAPRHERIIDSISLSATLPIAAEHGHWIGRRPNGEVAFSGTYLAMWRRSKSIWKLRSELFITLT